MCDGSDRDNEYSTHAHLGQLIGLLGPPPKELLDRGEEAALHFRPDGKADP
jgi:serine/threonine-protein kinase SRPK3